MPALRGLLTRITVLAFLVAILGTAGGVLSAPEAAHARRGHGTIQDAVSSERQRLFEEEGIFPSQPQSLELPEVRAATGSTSSTPVIRRSFSIPAIDAEERTYTPSLISVPAEPESLQSLVCQARVNLAEQILVMQTRDWVIERIARRARVSHAEAEAAFANPHLCDADVAPAPPPPPPPAATDTSAAVLCRAQGNLAGKQPSPQTWERIVSRVSRIARISQADVALSLQATLDCPDLAAALIETQPEPESTTQAIVRSVPSTTRTYVPERSLPAKEPTTVAQPVVPALKQEPAQKMADQPAEPEEIILREDTAPETEDEMSDGMLKEEPIDGLADDASALPSEETQLAILCRVQQRIERAPEDYEVQLNAFATVLAERWQHEQSTLVALLKRSDLCERQDDVSLFAAVTEPTDEPMESDETEDASPETIERLLSLPPPVLVIGGIVLAAIVLLLLLIASVIVRGPRES